MSKRENGEGARGVWKSCQIDVGLTSRREGRKEGRLGRKSLKTAVEF